MKAPSVALRHAFPIDAITIAALSVQVFLDTYATDGIRPDLAREAFSVYSAEAFAQRIGEASRTFILAEVGACLLGFAEVMLSQRTAPDGQTSGAELVRLYVQPAAQHNRIGRALLERAEQVIVAHKLSSVWLAAWDRNTNARAFYAHMGYVDVGATTYSFEGHTYANRVFAKHLSVADSSA